MYDAHRRLTGVLYSSPDMDYEIQNDAYGNATNVQDAAGNIWRHVYGFNSKMLGEMFIQGDGATGVQGATYFVAATNDIARAYDSFDRPTGYALAVNGETKGGVGYAYDTDGRISRITATNSAGRSFTVAYANVAGYNCGYTITLPSGGTVRRAVERDDYRRNLVTNCSTCFNSSLVDLNLYAFDALSRPIARTTSRTGCQPVQSAFIYNDRSEVVSAAIGTNIFSHAYDSIGNHVLFSDHLTTNTFAHNQANQMVGRVVLNAPSAAFAYTPDGGLSFDGDWDYAYDAEDRLVSVTSSSLTNGAIRVQNSYDYRYRRISKTLQQLSVTVLPPPSPPIETYEWNTVEYRTFAYDDWNLIHETVAAIDGGTTNVFEIQYYWGLDLSGSLQGAGGVGGLLAVSRNGQFYFPTFDNNGNLTKYIDESGNTVAAYEYDDFGHIISQSGPLADFFRHRFSTKFYETETGLCYYGYRFYHPALMRWLNRDPIGERGGLNLYAYCKNAASCFFDDLGGQTSPFTFAGDPNKKNEGRSVGDYIALWGPNQGSFSVMWEYEGSDCCDENKETEKHGPLFFNATSDYYPVWNMETIDENVPIPYLTPAFGVNGLSGATQGKVYGEKGKMTITVIWTSSSAPANTYLNPTGNTDYYRHGAAWNLPNHFPWTDRPFAPFGNEGKVKNQGSQKVVITASWNNCTRAGEEIGTRISGVNETGSSIGIGKPRNKQR